MMNRKAEASIVRDLMIFVLVFFIMLAIVLQIRSFFGGDDCDVASLNICRQSAAIASKADALKMKVIKLDCPVCEREFKEDDLLNSVGEVSKRKLKEAIAGELMDCWFKFGEGKFNPFESQIVSDKKICSFCSDLSFEDDVVESYEEEKGTTEITDFKEFLANAKVKDSDVTYKSYFERSGLSLDVILFDLADTIDIKDSFKVIYSSYIPAFVTRGISSATGATGPGTRISGSIFLLESEAIEKYGCEVLYN